MTSTQERVACPECGYENDPQALTCSMCSALLPRDENDDRGGAATEAYDALPTVRANDRWFPGMGEPWLGTDPGLQIEPEPKKKARERIAAEFGGGGWRAYFPDAVLYALGGMVLCPLLILLPGISKVGWFCTALTHELGHTIAAWFLGCPAIPVIDLSGHAASVHQEQKLFIVPLVWGAIGFLAWKTRRRRLLLIATLTLGVCYPGPRLDHAGS